MDIQEIQSRLKKFQEMGKEIPSPEMIKNEEQIAGIREACKLNTAILNAVSKIIRPGLRTIAIDELVYDFTIKHGGTPADLGFMGFPKSCCTSVNDIICHGIPGDYVLKNGDIINVDLTTEYHGFYGDASRMFMVGKVSQRARNLVNITKECMLRGIRAAQAWATTGDIGAAIGPFAKKHGYTVMLDYGGHGVGVSNWEDPYICHVGRRGEGMVLVPGMVVTVEPMINEGTDEYYEDEMNNWEVHTADGGLSAQWENTILITEKGPEILSQ